MMFGVCAWRMRSGGSHILVGCKCDMYWNIQGDSIFIYMQKRYRDNLYVAWGLHIRSIADEPYLSISSLTSRLGMVR